MFSALILLADSAQDPAGRPPAADLFSSLFPILMLGVLAYFLLLRPMKKQEQERQRMLSTVKKNDRVVTSGGIIGVVASVKDKEDEVTLKVDDNSPLRLRVTKSSIVRILNADESAKDGKEGGA